MLGDPDFVELETTSESECALVADVSTTAVTSPQAAIIVKVAVILRERVCCDEADMFLRLHCRALETTPND